MEKTLPLISVIVPIYNVEPYLKRCVESIQNQTYKNLEIILVDDGSPDNCGKMCDEFAVNDKRIKVVHRENGGLSAARNSGLDIATGDYVGFVDSDDYIENDMYRELFIAISENNVNICTCGCNVVDEEKKLIYSETWETLCKYSDVEVVEKILLPLKTSLCNKLFQRDIIGHKRMPLNVVYGEDLIFFTSLLCSSLQVVVIPYCGYNYVKHQNTITTSAFNSHSFDEVYCKDFSYTCLIEKYPQYRTPALSWCFRARLNLLRKLLVIPEKANYMTNISDYIIWLKQHHKMCKKHLSFKSNMEFFILIMSKTVYKWMIVLLQL